ncbi:MAG TPA: GDP-mannose 4,6-dehydratase, partial [Acidimicrobiales bacterium]|nr:GDP-mannose 4,6-dehydratase [Acidimicrobiales bacterium]
MRAFVTGGKGFVGSWLVSHLQERGDEVVAVDREIDVCDAAALRSALTDAAPDAVYHLAALTHVGRSWADPEQVVRVNVLGTLHVLEAARRCRPVPRVLVVSSAEVYGALDESALPAGEDSVLAPVTPYAASKVAAEFVAVQAHLGNGVPVIRVRPFNHVGPGQAEGFVVPGLAKRIVEARRQGRDTLPVGNLSARRDLTDVRDVVRAYRLLVERGQPGEVYNVCSGRAWSIAEVADRLLATAGAELKLVEDPDLVRPVDVPLLVGDPGRIRVAVGWVPEIPIDRTLADVLDEW